MEQQSGGRQIRVRREYSETEEYREHLESDGKFLKQKNEAYEAEVMGLSGSWITLSSKGLRVIALPTTILEVIEFISKIVRWVIGWLRKLIGK